MRRAPHPIQITTKAIELQVGDVLVLGHARIARTRLTSADCHGRLVKTTACHALGRIQRITTIVNASRSRLMMLMMMMMTIQISLRFRDIFTRAILELRLGRERLRAVQRVTITSAVFDESATRRRRIHGHAGAGRVRGRGGQRLGQTREGLFERVAFLEQLELVGSGRLMLGVCRLERGVLRLLRVHDIFIIHVYMALVADADDDDDDDDDDGYYSRNDSRDFRSECADSCTSWACRCCYY